MKKTLFCTILFLSTSLFSFTLPGAGVPVDVLIVINYLNDKQEVVTIAQCNPNSRGEIKFSFPDGIKIPKSGVFTFVIKPPIQFKGSDAKKYSGMVEQTIKVPFNRKDGPKFIFSISWEQKSKSNQGGFAVSGRNSSYR